MNQEEGSVLFRGHGAGLCVLHVKRYAPVLLAAGGGGRRGPQVCASLPVLAPPLPTSRALSALRKRRRAPGLALLLPCAICACMPRRPAQHGGSGRKRRRGRARASSSLLGEARFSPGPGLLLQKEEMLVSARCLHSRRRRRPAGARAGEVEGEASFASEEEAHARSARTRRQRPGMRRLPWLGWWSGRPSHRTDFCRRDLCFHHRASFQ